MCARHSLWPWLGAAILMAAAGCAPAYHAYPCGCVPYGYCPDPPLPLTNYCGCPTPWAARFYREHPAPPLADQEETPITPAPSSGSN